MSLCATNPLKDYRTYYEDINRAELFIVKYNFESALKIYRSVFSNYKNHDTKDLYNASICAIRSHDYDFASSCMQELVSLGYSMNEFQKQSFDSLPNFYKNLLSSKYDSLNKVYKSKFDLQLKNLLDSIDDQEQVFFKQKPLFSYDSLVLEHAKILKMTLEKKNLPEVPMFEGHMKIPGALFRHHFGVMNKYRYLSPSDPLYNKLDFTKYSLRDLLLKAVMNGELSPQIYSFLIEYNELDKNKTTGKVTVNIDLDKRNVSLILPAKDQIEIINRNRSKIGLESFEDAAIKNIGVDVLLNNYPFEEHLALAKKFGLNLSTADTVSFEIKGEFVMESNKLETKAMGNSLLKDFNLLKNTLFFIEKLPSK